MSRRGALRSGGRPSPSTVREPYGWPGRSGSGGNWDIYARRYTPDRGGGQGTLSDVVRLSSDAGSDFHVVSATDSRGVVWLAWQAWRGGNYEIMTLALADGHPWREPRAISGSRANDWSPAIAADSRGGVFVAWDTYDQGNYDVRLRQVGTAADTITIAASPRFEARCSLACDGNDRLWIAYEEGDEQWGKDYANANPELVPVQNGGYPLYEHRTVRVKCLVGGKLMQPSGSLEEAWGHLRLGKSLPRIAADARGGIWLLVRHHPLPGGAGEVWHSFALHHDGQSWSAPRHLIDSAGLIDNRPVLLPRRPGDAGRPWFRPAHQCEQPGPVRHLRRQAGLGDRANATSGSGPGLARSGGDARLGPSPGERGHRPDAESSRRFGWHSAPASPRRVSPAHRDLVPSRWGRPAGG